MELLRRGTVHCGSRVDVDTVRGHDGRPPAAGLCGCGEPSGEMGVASERAACECEGEEGEEGRMIAGKEEEVVVGER